MKTNLNKSTKRALSLVLAFAMLIGSLFTANIGINISADAATLNVQYWDGSTVSTSLSGSGTEAEPYLIKSVADFAYVATGADGTTAGEYYKIDDGIDALVLQPETYGAAIMALDSADAVRTYFETNKSSLKKWVYESATASAGFNGYFDGNGAIICGMYTNTSGSIGLFTNLNSSTIENVIIKNNYASGDSAAIVCSQSKDSGAVYNFNKCELTNNVVVATRLNDYSTVYYGGLLLAITTKAFINIDNCIIYGNIATHSESVNYWCYETSESTSTKAVAISGYDVTYGLWGTVAGNGDNGTSGYNTVSNSIILDTFPHAVAWDYNGTYYTNYNNVYTNMANKTVVNTVKGATGANKSGTDWTELTLQEKVYTITTPITSAGLYDLNVKTSATTSTGDSYDANCIKPDDYSGITSVDSEGAKGSLGKLAMDKLDWATDNADATWYAIDGEYPTLFKPEGWTDCETIKLWDGTAAESFAADAEGNYGDGTAENPYLIETAEQLWAMVKAGGKQTDGTPAYYKVKDGVKNLYLSKAISGGYAAVKSLASGTAGTDYNNWNTGAWTVFEGNFDGNGVTIRGMISKSTSANTSVGLIHVFGEDAIVKNINFDTCYAYNSSAANAALLASKVIGYKDENADGTSTDCKNCITYKDTGSYCVAHGNSSSATEDCGGTSCQYSGDTDKCENHNGGGKDGYNLIYNVSVRNSSIQSSNNTQCAGLVVSYSGYADMLQVVNCLYDGYSCELGNGATGANANAGLIAFSWGLNNAMASGCVSLNAPVFSNRSGTDTNYNDYTTGNKSGHPVYMYNCYTDVKENVDSTVVELVDENGASTVSNLTDAQTLINSMPLLDWVNGWYVAEDADGRVVPMPRVRTAADVTATWDTGETVLHYNRWLSTADGGTGTSPYNGKNGRFEKFVGSGTEADPYIISTPLELARAIGVGGTKLNNKLYFKLACDIDLSDMPWLNTVGTRPTNASSTSYDRVYTYVPFEGVLDGDGHTITGLYAVNGNTDEASYGTYSNAAGLIPVLASGGVVKNLHIRNSYAASGTGYAGALVGEAQAGSTVSGCSVEDCIVVSTSDTDYHMIGSAGGYIENLYYIAGEESTTSDKTIYVDAGTVDENGNMTASGTVLTTAIEVNADNSDVWYKGGLESSMPQLVNRAAAMSETDVSGLGDTDYNSADLSALRNKLLRKSAYQYIYGDVNRDGSINSTDLVILRRAMVDDYKDLQDGFWRNVECGKVAIYYSENDTQDMARKLELYFESEVPGLDMMKYATSDETVTDSSLTSEDIKAAPTENAVIITQGDPASVAYNEYSVTYENDNNLVTIYGGSFTAVEQAVIYFMAGSSRATGDVYTIAAGDILTETLTDTKIVLSEDSSTELVTGEDVKSDAYSYKQSVTVGGKTYYYAWGDEFEGVSDTISSNNWAINKYRGENADGTTSMYTNQESANLEDLKTLWVCTDGRLSIWRGVNTAINSDSSTWDWGYKGINLGTDTTNDFGREIDANDVYIDPGLITTKNSMLFKQGYVEMEASLPSDGHAFPAWWFLTYSGDKNNTTIANSLYGKVLKENSNWVNTNTGNFTPGDISTYKYQLPSAHLELDIVEPMQYLYDGTSATAYKYPVGTSSAYKKEIDTYNHYKRDFSVTVHKIYDENATSDNLYIFNWAESSIAKTIARSDFTTTSSSGTWIHRYNGNNYFDYNGDVYQGYSLADTWYNSGSEAAASYNMARKMTGTVKYGFSWSVNVTNNEYDLKIYVDLDGDGIMADSEMVMAINEETGHADNSNDPTYTNGDADLWNQYAYMLLDNTFYTASSGKVDGNNVDYTDLLTQETTGSTDYKQGSFYTYANYQIKDKTTFDISYVRVYQQDGMRDIVTRDTEAFNNGDHFGYGE